MNGVGVPSVKCQISNRSKTVLHIQFEGQYLPQYDVNLVFSVTGLILLWKLGYPAFNIIGVHFQSVG